MDRGILPCAEPVTKTSRRKLFAIGKILPIKATEDGCGSGAGAGVAGRVGGLGG